MVAKFLDDNKPKIYLKIKFVLFHSSILFNAISVICQMLAKFSGLNPKQKENNCVVFTNSIKRAREIRKFHVSVATEKKRTKKRDARKNWLFC